MKTKVFTAGALAVSLCCAPLAIAAQGETSGPAAGTNVTPSTATQKQASNPNGSTAAGAPGMAGKQGGESGAKPETGPNSSHK